MSSFSRLLAFAAAVVAVSASCANPTPVSTTTLANGVELSVMSCASVPQAIGRRQANSTATDVCGEICMPCSLSMSSANDGMTLRRCHIVQLCSRRAAPDNGRLRHHQGRRGDLSRVEQSELHRPAVPHPTAHIPDLPYVFREP